jgi:hypothetical protein
MRRIWLVLGAAGLAAPGFAKDGASSRVNPKQVELRRPAGGVLVAENPAGYKLHPGSGRRAPTANVSAVKLAPNAEGKTSLKAPAQRERPAIPGRAKVRD